MTGKILTAAMTAFVLTATTAARADAVSDFYRGKTITLQVGAGAGGSYDIYARTLAEHMPEHIPGKPSLIVKMAGGAGGGLPTANQAQNTMARDGSAIVMTQQTIVANQLLYPKSAHYDVRTWNWIGLMAPTRNMLAVWHTAPAQTLEEATKKEVIIGATGRASPTYLVPQILNEMLGTKFKIVIGYNGVADLNLAMERGEIQGRGASWISVMTQAPQYITEHKLKPLVVDGLTPEPSIPDVPLMVDVAKTPQDKETMAFISSAAQFGRSVFAPPKVPADRLKALRAAFAATMKDPAFLAVAKSRKIPIEPQGGDVLRKTAAKIVASSPQAVAAARKLMGIEGSGAPK
ncbi:MAG TPA: tripartite tricarboxylate transporter substrate-binding protein [Alphaproteobacteria bacterium]|nr:tripartite tricarboxylate transporter substrate-binding protein [Alphaproteobacteria bacterium]